MKNQMKILMLTAFATAGFTASATAQDSLSNLRGDDFGVRAAVSFTVPFGQMGPQAKQEKARFAAGLTMDRYAPSARNGQRDMRALSIINLGFFETGEPSFQLYGQELYAPLFDPLYAAEEGEPTPTGLETPIDRGGTKGGGAALAVLGVVALGGIVVLVSESNDQIDDCFESIFGDNEC